MPGRQEMSCARLRVRGSGSPEATLGVRGFFTKGFFKVWETPDDSAEPGTPRDPDRGASDFEFIVRVEI